eukprot:SAG22_NODE_86_length_21440_cov_288.248700_23_plen_226_part_00
MLFVCRLCVQFHDHKPDALAHYDIKPGNVLLANDGTPTLMDFGSVRPARRHIKTRRDALELQEFASINCTMPYRAPELWEPPSQCEVDERVDVWSAGCLLFALFYGHSPFELAVAEMGACGTCVHPPRRCHRRDCRPKARLDVALNIVHGLVDKVVAVCCRRRVARGRSGVWPGQIPVELRPVRRVQESYHRAFAKVHTHTQMKRLERDRIARTTRSRVAVLSCR